MREMTLDKKDFELGRARRLIIALIQAHADKNEKEFKRLVEEDLNWGRY